jgi:putative transposase
MVRHSLNYVRWKLRKFTKNRGSFPSDDGLLKLFYLALADGKHKI